MPVFDFNHTSEKESVPACTYTTYLSNEEKATPEKPILILDNHKKEWPHHACGVFTNPVYRTSFEFKEEKEAVSADILKVDARFVSLIRWLEKTGYMCVCPVKTARRVTAYAEFVRLLLAEAKSCRQRMVFFSI